MVLRAAVALGSLLAVTPVLAEPMNAEAARRFVAGKLFSFTCFEGTAGAGRIQADGSIAGIIRFQGKGPTKFLRRRLKPFAELVFRITRPRIFLFTILPYSDLNQDLRRRLRPHREHKLRTRCYISDLRN